jgi:ketosteroid isomerase-like protein
VGWRLTRVLSFELRELIAECDKVVALGNYSWRVRANDREFGGDFAHVWTIRDGRSTEFQECVDTAVGVSAYQKVMSA